LSLTTAVKTLNYTTETENPNIYN